LPLYIGRLKALVSLNVSYNMLKRLPQSIGNIKNLIILDLSYNKLMYLPVVMIHLQNLLYLDISMNPFQIHKLHMLYQIRVQSLVKLSANIVLQYRFVVSFNLSHKHIHAHTHTHTKHARACVHKVFLFMYLLCYIIFYLN